MKRFITIVALAGTLLVGSAGVAFAASGSSTTAPSGAAATVHSRRALLRREALGVAAKTIGISRQDLRQDLANGQTIAQVAQSKGVDVQTVIDALVKAGTARADQALQNGRITQTQHDTIVSKLPDVASTFVNRQWGQHQASTTTGS